MIARPRGTRTVSRVHVITIARIIFTAGPFAFARATSALAWRNKSGGNDRADDPANVAIAGRFPAKVGKPADHARFISLSRSLAHVDDLFGR